MHMQESIILIYLKKSRNSYKTIRDFVLHSPPSKDIKKT